MTDFTVRTLVEGELRTAHDVFRAALHESPQAAERWKYVARLYDAARTFGAFAGDALVGTVTSFLSSLALPGGRVLPMAAVTGVGVRSDFRRRGMLTELSRVQLAAAASGGEVFAGLHASEGAIYGRFGYGIATHARKTTVLSRRAEIRPEVPRGGEVRLLDVDETLAVLPGVYDRLLGPRPGMMGRSAGWWSMAYERRLRSDEPLLAAAHTGPDGVDGFVAYFAQPGARSSDDVTLKVLDLQAANQAAANDLWRFLLGMDLVGEVSAYLRPMDEPLEAMLVDQYVVRSELDDDLWLRLLDVPAALAARDYGDADPIVLEVRDSWLPNNSGRYRISPQGTEPTIDPADVTLTSDALAMIYLGTTRPSALAGIGRIQVTSPTALPRADRLFATELTSWCGTMF